MSFRRSLIAIVAALAVLVVPSAAGATEPRLKVLADGLDHPRGLDIGRFGGIYVTEAGRGGSGPCRSGPEGEECYGATGAVTRIWHGTKHRVLRGLPSLAAPGSGEGATGPQDISIGPFPGTAYFVTGWGGEPDGRDDLGSVGRRFGQLYRVSLFSGPRAVADISQYEQDANPDESETPDSNPTGVLSRFGRRIVVDAGGNDLLRVSLTGRISTLAVFPQRLVPPPGPHGQPPSIPMDAVPTQVAVGPDGAYYVSQLTGFPFPVGGARIYRVVPGQAPTIYARGLTNVTDLAFAPDGSLYVVEFTTNGLLSNDPAGALKRVRRNGSIETVVSEGLEVPYGVAVDRKGRVYVTNRGAVAGAGQVLRVKTGR